MPQTQPLLEERIQQDCVTWFRNTYPDVRYLLYKNHNEGKKNLIAAGKDKAMGLTAGIPDLCLAIPNTTYHGLYIELKRPGERPSAIQKERIAQLKDQGYKVIVITTLTDFQNEIQLYLSTASI